MELISKLLKRDADKVLLIRKEFNFVSEERREEAFRTLEDWLAKQPHFTKKSYNREYLEKCILTSKGSVEAAKTQIDKMCTFRTMFPEYFKYSDVYDPEMAALDKFYVGYSSRLTEEGYRVFLLKLKPNITVKQHDFIIFHAFCLMAGELLKSYDYCTGIITIIDGLDVNLGDILSNASLVEIQNYLPISTEGQGCKMKGMYFLTKSKLVERFVNLLKPLLKEKVRNRINIMSTKDQLREMIPADVLPKNYGGTEKPIEELHEDLMNCMSSKAVKELLKELNAARTDETKRQRDVFNNQYMGMSGTFRSMTLD